MRDTKIVKTSIDSILLRELSGLLRKIENHPDVESIIPGEMSNGSKNEKFGIKIGKYDERISSISLVLYNGYNQQEISIKLKPNEDVEFFKIYIKRIDREYFGR